MGSETTGSDTTVNNYNIDVTTDASEYDDYSNPDVSTYLRNISLRYFAANSFAMLTNHARLKELCLENDNPEAHYIEGILRFFVHQERKKGLFHLRQSAILNNSNGILLYGLIMLARGSYLTGKRYLDKLRWMENRLTSDQFWERIQNSLKEIHVPMKRKYYVSMVNLEPRTNCDLDDNDELCNDCYYYKRLRLFVKFTTDNE